MNFFSKNRILVWILIILIILNVSAFISFVVMSRHKTEHANCCTGAESTCRALSDELGLTRDQADKVACINAVYRDAASPLAEGIRQKREMMLSELEKERPDTAVLNDIVRTMTNMRTEIQQKNITQYLELKKVCTPSQALRLSTLYRDLYGCPMQENKMHRGHQNGKCKGMNDSACQE